MIKIYTDGSANKKSCGCAIVVFDEEDNYIYHNAWYCQDSTNNKEEIKAILAAYGYLACTDETSDCIIYSDSAYCVNMINEWIDNWQARGWCKYDGKEIKNLELVKALYNFKHRFPNAKVYKVEGHANNLGNELADAFDTNNQKKIDRFDKVKKFL